MDKYISLPLDKEGVSHSKELFGIMGPSLVHLERRGTKKNEKILRLEKGVLERELVGRGKGKGN